MAASVHIEQTGSNQLWVVVTCKDGGKRASALAEKAARAWVNAHPKFRKAYRRSSSQRTVRGGAVRYRTAFALDS